MAPELKTCECGKQFTEEQSSGRFCYRCKLNGLSFNWVGGGSYGRQAFHDRTVGEVMRQTENNAKNLGIKYEKKSTRAVLV